MWNFWKGKAAGTICLIDVQSIITGEEEEIAIVLSEEWTNYASHRLSSSEMRFVEAVWRDLGPDGSTWVRLVKQGVGKDPARIFFVNGYIYFALGELVVFATFPRWRRRPWLALRNSRAGVLQWRRSCDMLLRR